LPRAAVNKQRAGDLQRAAAKSGVELNPRSHVPDMEIQSGRMREEPGIGGAIEGERSGGGSRVAHFAAEELKGCF